ncbi:MAG: DUF3106 domain-containing protein [Burkholderiaceae bacterium]
MRARRKRRLRLAASIGLLAVASALALPLRAADTVAKATTAVTTSSVPAFKPARPYWLELTVAQRQALAPLSDDWERLDSQTKKKWVAIANRYPKMKPDEQQHTQERMREWALLTPDQRRVARDSFARVRAMPPEQRAEMLRKYRELPDAKKHELASQSQATKMLLLPKPQATPPSRRVQISEGAKVKNPAIAAQKAAAPAPARTPAPAPVVAKPVEAIKPMPTNPTPPVAPPAVLPPAAPPADAPAK